MSEGKALPFDFVFFGGKSSKLFGIQYKPLYRNGNDYWPLSADQHGKLQHFEDWAYYGFSELKDVADQGNALHHSLFVPANIKYQEKILKRDLRRPKYLWGEFVAGLESCKFGRKITNKDDFEAALRPVERELIREIDGNLVDLFVADFENRRLVHLDGR